MHQVLSGLRFPRNRITHEVGYVLAAAKQPDSLAAIWTWQSLLARPNEGQTVLHQLYQQAIAGRDVVATLLEVTVFLGAARNRMWQHYGEP